MFVWLNCVPITLILLPLTPLLKFKEEEYPGQNMIILINISWDTLTSAKKTGLSWDKQDLCAPYSKEKETHYRCSHWKLKLKLWKANVLYTKYLETHNIVANKLNKTCCIFAFIFIKGSNEKPPKTLLGSCFEVCPNESLHTNSTLAIPQFIVNCSGPAYGDWSHWPGLRVRFGQITTCLTLFVPKFSVLSISPGQ